MPRTTNVKAKRKAAKATKRVAKKTAGKARSMESDVQTQTAASASYLNGLRQATVGYGPDVQGQKSLDYVRHQRSRAMLHVLTAMHHEGISAADLRAAIDAVDAHVG